jgi:hypothetical protein
LSHIDIPCERGRLSVHGETEKAKNKPAPSFKPDTDLGYSSENLFSVLLSPVLARDPSRETASACVFRRPVL